MNNLHIITKQSKYGVKEAVLRLHAELKNRKIPVFAVIDHARNAGESGLVLRPTTVVIFGNPAVGTMLMRDERLMALDLPLRMLVWEDEAGQSWLSYHDIREQAREYSLKENRKIIDAVAGLMTELEKILC